MARQGDSHVILPLRIDDRLADGVVFIPAALAATAGFGQAICGDYFTTGRAL